MKIQQNLTNSNEKMLNLKQKFKAKAEFKKNLALLAPNLSLAADKIFIGAKFSKSHRTTGVKLTCRNANLSPKAKLTPIAKAS